MYTMRVVRLNTFYSISQERGPQWRSWFRLYATSRRVAGHWIFFIDVNRPAARGSTQTPTEMSTRNIYWSKGGQCVGLISYISFADCREAWEPQPPGTLCVCPDLYKYCFTGMSRLILAEEYVEVCIVDLNMSVALHCQVVLSAVIVNSDL
jgi:hypothetical protein